ncbi:hypothetical protein IJI00_00975 [Candidatus Saccharibacteria bacterium]|nr:hypothetical protein [Candidatus Saccharibacteria bacterium]
MYNPDEMQAKERRKVIIFAVATVAVILALIVSIVVVATNKTSVNLGGEENTEFTLVEDKKETEKPATTTKSASNTNAAASNTTAKTTSPAIVTPTSVPNTGPEDLLPIALGLGALTTVVTTVVLNKRRA